MNIVKNDYLRLVDVHTLELEGYASSESIEHMAEAVCPLHVTYVAEDHFLVIAYLSDRTRKRVKLPIEAIKCFDRVMFKEHHRYVINGIDGVTNILCDTLLQGYHGYDDEHILDGNAPAIVCHLLSGGWMQVVKETKRNTYDMNVYDKSGNLICGFYMSHALINPNTFKEYE